MWQEIITYAILAATFGIVIYKSIIRPIIRFIRPKEQTQDKQLANICATCPAVSCQTCPFYNPNAATYHYKTVKLDSAQESEKVSKNTDTVQVAHLHHAFH